MPVALVTGASRGIGRAIAAALAAEGFDLGVLSRSAAELRTVASSLSTERGVRSLAIPADLREPGAVDLALASCVAGLGAPSVLVHNAGTAPSARLEDSPDVVLDETLDLHLRAPFRLIRSALPHLRRQGQATVVLMGSTAGLRGYPFTAAYGAAKHGTVGLARALAAEWAKEPALRVFVVCPGFVDTEITRNAARSVAARGKKNFEEALAAFGAMNRIGRLHSAEEVAQAVARLVRERPVGTVLDLDQPEPALEP